MAPDIPVTASNLTLSQDYIDEHVAKAMEEVSEVMRSLIEEAVHADISEAMEQSNEGEPADGMVVVDTEGNRLEVLSVDEQGVIEVGILMGEDQDEENDQSRRGVSPLDAGLK